MKKEVDNIKEQKKRTISRKTPLRTLFTDFLKFGLFTFGGGWSIVAQMEKIYVEDRKVVSSHELLDLTSVGRSLPGTMIGNIAVLFGYSQQGIPGALISLFAMILPPFLVLLIVAGCYTAFRTNFWVASAMSGIRCAVVPIILTAALKMFDGAFRFPPCYIVTVICILLYVVFNVSCVYLVIFGAVSGLIISEIYARKEN